MFLSCQQVAPCLLWLICWARSGHLVTVIALRTFIPSLRCLTNRKRGLISPWQARAAKKKKKIKTHYMIIHQLLSGIFIQTDTSARIGQVIRVNTGLFFGYGIYLQGLHLLGTVMVVSISWEGCLCPFSDVTGYFQDTFIEESVDRDIFLMLWQHGIHVLLSYMLNNDTIKR